MSVLDVPESPPDLRRIRVLLAGIGFSFLCIVARLWYLQIVRGDELYAVSETNRTRLIRRVPPRGQILDSSGHVIATSHPRLVVSVVPDEINRNPGSLPRLAALLGAKTSELEETVEELKISPFDP